MNAVGELAHLTGIVPLLWLVVLHLAGKQRGREWWWLAVALSISWVADTLAHWFNPTLVGNLYPVTQAAIIGATLLLHRREAVALVLLLGFVGVCSMLVQDPRIDADMILSTAANGSAAVLAYEFRGPARLRAALLMLFGLGGVAWIAFIVEPIWATYLVYQSCRAAGTVWFCVAALSPYPAFNLMRTVHARPREYPTARGAR